MKLPHFLLDDWLNIYHSRGIRYDLASSTGPKWHVNELLQLEGVESVENFLHTSLFYSSAKGDLSLREALGEFYSVDPDHVQIVTGASEALLIFFFMHSEPESNVVVPGLAYPPMVEIPRSFGIEVRHYQLDKEWGFKLNTDEIKSLCDSNTKMILINSPHNPTGAVVPFRILKELHDFAWDKGIQFVVDEVYHPIYHNESVVSAAGLEHATIIGDMSKSFCMGGLRTGWIIQQDKVKIGEYQDTRSYFTIANTTIGEALSVIAVKNRERIFSKVKQITETNLKELNQFFNEFSDIFGWVKPEGGMTAYPWLLDQSDSRKFCIHMAEKEVLLAPGDCFGEPNHIRVGFAAAGETFPEAVDIMMKETRQFFK